MEPIVTGWLNRGIGTGARGAPVPGPGMTNSLGPAFPPFGGHRDRAYSPPF